MAQLLGLPQPQRDSMVVYLDSEDDDEEELTSSEVSSESEPDSDSEV